MNDDKDDGNATSEVSESSNQDSHVKDAAEEPFLEIGAICKEHHMKIHSWQTQTRKLLCTKCIQLGNIPNQYIRIFPQAVREIKSQMLEAKALNKQRKLQLTQVMMHVTEAQQKNKQNAKNKLD